MYLELAAEYTKLFFSCLPHFCIVLLSLRIQVWFYYFSRYWLVSGSLEHALKYVILFFVSPDRPHSILHRLEWICFLFSSIQSLFLVKYTPHFFSFCCVWMPGTFAEMYLCFLPFSINFCSYFFCWIINSYSFVASFRENWNSHWIVSLTVSLSIVLLENICFSFNNYFCQKNIKFWVWTSSFLKTWNSLFCCVVLVNMNSAWDGYCFFVSLSNWSDSY